MSVTIKTKVERCIDCPYSERHQILTPDSFEYDIGVFCSKMEGDMRHYTYDGTITKRISFSYERPSEIDIAKIPDWCPYRQ